MARTWSMSRSPRGSAGWRGRGGVDRSRRRSDRRSRGPRSPPSRPSRSAASRVASSRERHDARRRVHRPGRGARCASHHLRRAARQGTRSPGTHRSDWVSRRRRLALAPCFVLPLGFFSSREVLPVFLGSSMAEHPAVNRRVAGSSPARGANHSRFALIRGPRPVLSHAAFASLGLAGSSPARGAKLAERIWPPRPEIGLNRERASLARDSASPARGANLRFCPHLRTRRTVYCGGGRGLRSTAPMASSRSGA